MLMKNVTRFLRAFQQANVGNSFHFNLFKIGIATQSTGYQGFNEQKLTDKCALLEWCKDNVLYEDENLIAINKPAGVPQYSIPSVTSKGNNSIVGVDELIPLLCDTWKVPSLKVSVPFSRYHSGVMLLTKNTPSCDRIKQILQTAKVQKEAFLSHIAITVGVPVNIKENPTETMIFTKKKIGDMDVTITIPNQTVKGREHGTQLQTYFNSRVLSVNEELGVSAVQIQMNRDKWHCLEVYLTRKMCSALGDHMYSGRVKPVMSKMAVVTPEAAIREHQVLPKNIRNALKVQADVVKSIPLHVHRYQVELFQFPTKKSKPLVIKAPLPGYYERSLHLLDLFNDNIHRILDTDML